MTDTTMQLLSQGTDPVKMPDFDILAEGKTLSGVAERLMSLSLTDNRGFEADQLTITLDDADGQLQLPPRGARLTVLIGWKGEPLTEKGTYIVDEIAHEGPPDRLTVSARSADFRDEFNVKREVSWHDVTVERVVSAIAHRWSETANQRNADGYRNRPRRPDRRKRHVLPYAHGGNAGRNHHGKKR